MNRVYCVPTNKRNRGRVTFWLKKRKTMREIISAFFPIELAVIPSQNQLEVSSGKYVEPSLLTVFALFDHLFVRGLHKFPVCLF